jgi:hypothetical protein
MQRASNTYVHNDNAFVYELILVRIFRADVKQGDRMSVRKIAQNAARPVVVETNTQPLPWKKWPQNLGYICNFQKKGTIAQKANNSPNLVTLLSCQPCDPTILDLPSRNH